MKRVTLKLWYRIVPRGQVCHLMTNNLNFFDVISTFSHITTNTYVICGKICFVMLNFFWQSCPPGMVSFLTSVILNDFNMHHDAGCITNKVHVRTKKASLVSPILVDLLNDFAWIKCRLVGLSWILCWFEVEKSADLSWLILMTQSCIHRYMGATAVQKDLIILLDGGNSMGDGLPGDIFINPRGFTKFTASVNMIKELLDTLNYGDRVSVVIYSSSSTATLVMTVSQYDLWSQLHPFFFFFLCNVVILD